MWLKRSGRETNYLNLVAGFFERMELGLYSPLFLDGVLMDNITFSIEGVNT
jgi:hypothetical protein